MPIMTFPTSPDGLAVEVLLGLNDADRAVRQAAGLPVPLMVYARGLLDTACDATAVSPRLIQHLGPSLQGRTSTVTAGTSVIVNRFRLSVLIPGPTGVMGVTLVNPDVVVTELAQPLPNVEVLVGLDILRECLLIADWPGHRFTLAF